MQLPFGMKFDHLILFFLYKIYVKTVVVYNLKNNIYKFTSSTTTTKKKKKRKKKKKKK